MEGSKSPLTHFNAQVPLEGGFQVQTTPLEKSTGLKKYSIESTQKFLGNSWLHKWLLRDRKTGRFISKTEATKQGRVHTVTPNTKKVVHGLPLVTLSHGFSYANSDLRNTLITSYRQDSVRHSPGVGDSIKKENKLTPEEVKEMVEVLNGKDLSKQLECIDRIKKRVDSGEKTTQGLYWLIAKLYDPGEKKNPFKGKNKNSAYYWYKKAAEEKNKDAMFALYKLLSNEKGSMNDSHEAWSWLEKAASQGSEKASNEVRRLKGEHTQNSSNKTSENTLSDSQKAVEESTHEGKVLEYNTLNYSELMEYYEEVVKKIEALKKENKITMSAVKGVLYSASFELEGIAEYITSDEICRDVVEQIEDFGEKMKTLSVLSSGKSFIIRNGPFAGREATVIAWRPERDAVSIQMPLGGPSATTPTKLLELL